MRDHLRGGIVLEGSRHEMQMTDRGLLRLTGVVSVESSEEEKILLKTVMGPLAIAGEGLHIRRLDLDSGSAEIGGRVDSFSYAMSGKQKFRSSPSSLWERLTK